MIPRWLRQMLCSHWDRTAVHTPASTVDTYGWYEQTETCNLCGKKFYQYVEDLV